MGICVQKKSWNMFVKAEAIFKWNLVSLIYSCLFTTYLMCTPPRVEIGHFYQGTLWLFLIHSDLDKLRYHPRKWV